MTLAEYIATFLAEKGVRHVFGYQGGAILKLVDEMMATGRMEYIQNYHEQASSFCADAYGRITGHLGVAVATSGPGATNLVTGIANAQMDSVPTLFLTGQDFSSHVKGRAENVRLNGFQDLDIVSIAKPITKYAAAIMDETTIRFELEKAYHLATTGRPGAVLLDIPIDLQFKEIDPSTQKAYIPETPDVPPSPKLEELVQLIQHAKRPVVLAGGGIHLSRTEEALQSFIASTHIPVVTTLNGVDAFAGSYSFSGLHGNTFANLAVQNADILIVLGARLGQQQVGKNKQVYTSAKVVHVDVDNAELGRALDENLSIHTDLPTFFNAFSKASQGITFPDFSGWHAHIRIWEEKYTSTTHLNTHGLDPVRALTFILRQLEDDAVIASDVGQNQMWVSQAFRKKGTQRLMNSSGLGSMGYSLPAAIGASYARPGAQVVSFAGDGGFQMNLQELMLLSQKRLPVKCVILNNNTLGMMRTSQKKYFEERYYGARVEDYASANIKGLAEAYGLPYLRIESETQLEQLIPVLKDDQPCLIELALPYHSLLSNRYDETAIFDSERIHDK
ncbi:MAG: thiamine pyrophosphate-binding protein [Alphaproteobacteria bacterium]|nr:MAG: thiamine pyrophosphate-binding protein [Alphaproteobacteria bacterium]